jgi:uncharacterized protein YndB with AHSA1/START domain
VKGRGENNLTSIGGCRVSVSRRIEAPVEGVFAVIADPARHPSFDGSEMVRDGRGNRPVGAVGDVFTMRMHNEEMGDYEMRNDVVAFERNRRIAWEPILSAASRPEDMAGVGDRAGHSWGYELEAEGTATVVTEIFDCSRAPDWLRKAVRDGERWRDTMTRTLELLDHECCHSFQSRGPVTA